MKKRKPMKTHQTAMRMTKQLRDDIQRLADAEDRPVSYYMRRVLEEHVAAKKRGKS